MINFLILILVIVVILILLTRLRPSNSESTQYFSKNSAPKNEWGSLNGKLLWSFMSGRVQFESRKPEEFRAIYEVVLVNHIYATFEQGKSDSALKLNRPPKNEIIVDSALGPVQSWIPFNISNTIYRCGCAWGRQDENELPYATAELNESCNTLFYLTGILRKEPISKSLMPRPDMTDPEKNEAESTLEIQPHELPEIRTQTSPAPTKPVDLTKV